MDDASGWYIVDRADGHKIVAGTFYEQDQAHAEIGRLKAEATSDQNATWDLWCDYGRPESLRPNPIEAWVSREIASKPIESVSFEVGYHCNQCGMVVKCPKCGMTACTGGYGTLPDGSDCDLCPAAYALGYAINLYADGLRQSADEIQKIGDYAEPQQN